MSLNPLVIQIAVLVGVSSALIWVYMLIKGGDPQLKARLDDLNDNQNSILNIRRRSRKSSQTFLESVKGMLREFGNHLLPTGDAPRANLQMQLVRAGIYAPSAPSILAAIKLILMLGPPLIGLAVGAFVLDDIQKGLLPGSLIGGAGMIVPSFWLARKTKKRQAILNRSLPDFLDLIIVCLESGLSFENALQRVTDELRSAHPLLAAELNIVQREMTLGRRTEDALQNFSVRSDLDVIRTLASFVQQARQFGSSMAETLRIHSEILRTKRELRAEELAQKAAVKVMFPTLLFIFPTIFVILIGPAAIEICDKFSEQSENASD